MSLTPKSVNVDVAALPPAAGTWSEKIDIGDGEKREHGVLIVAAAGSILTLQISPDGTNWYDHETYQTTGGTMIWCPVPGVFFRVGVKQADWVAAAAAIIKR